MLLKLADLVEVLRQRFGTVRAVAERIGISESGLVRGSKERGTLSVEHLLALAELADTPASEVLRISGKAAVADRLERLFGTGAAALTSSQRELLDVWGQIDDDHQPTALRTMRAFAAGHPRAVAPRGGHGSPPAPHRGVQRRVRKTSSGRQRTLAPTHSTTNPD